MAEMNCNQFYKLEEHQQMKLIMDADYVTEKVEGECKFELFKIDSFYVEVKTSVSGNYRKVVSCYSLRDLPAEYTGVLLSIPIVTLPPTECRIKTMSKISNQYSC